MEEENRHKYQILKQYILDYIKDNQLEAGDKIPSENVLAEQFSMSRHTVRQAIGELTNEGFITRVQGKGAYVNTPQKKEEMKTIAVMTTYLDDYIFPSIIRGIEQCLTEKGYHMMLFTSNNSHEKEKQELGRILESNVCGLIVESTKSVIPNPNIVLYEKIKAKGIPILFIHGTYDGLQSSYIVQDDEKGGFLAARHFIELGHTQIGGIFRQDEKQGLLRQLGCQMACKEYGVPLTTSWFSSYERFISEEDITYEAVYALSKNCTAILCYNDQIASMVLLCLKKMNLNVPQDISIISFDDSSIARATNPKLTSIAHPKELLGKKAGESIIQMIKDTTIEIKIQMLPNLVLGESVYNKNKE